MCILFYCASCFSTLHINQKKNKKKKQFYKWNMVTEWWEILDKLKKKEKKNTISLFVPPLEAPGALLRGHAPPV